MTKKENKEIMNAPVETVEVVDNTKEMKKDLTRVKKQLATCVKNLETNYIKLAVGLAYINSNELYKVEGYKNVYDFAKETYGIGKTTCYDFIGLVNTFALTADSQPLYTSKQMVAMLPYIRKGGSVDEFNADMSVREIKAYIKEHSARAEKEEEVVVDVEVKEEEHAFKSKKTIATFESHDDYNSKIDMVDQKILNLFEEPNKRYKVVVQVIEY